MLYNIRFHKRVARFPLELMQAFGPLLEEQSFIATANLECSLSLYRTTDWEVIELDIQRLSNSNVTVRRLQRLMLANATTVRQRSHGQIEFPEQLLTYSKVRDEAVALVFDHKLEIWNERELARHLEVPNGIKPRDLIGLLRLKGQDQSQLIREYICPGTLVTRGDS